MLCHDLVTFPTQFLRSLSTQSLCHLRASCPIERNVLKVITINEEFVK